MEKYKENVKLLVDKSGKNIEIFNTKNNETIDILEFENSHDFCKFFLELARDMGVSRFDFAAGCNAVADGIEGWDNL